MRLCLKKIKIRKSSKVELAIFALFGFLQRCVSGAFYSRSVSHRLLIPVQLWTLSGCSVTAVWGLGPAVQKSERHGLEYVTALSVGEWGL